MPVINAITAEQAASERFSGNEYEVLSYETADVSANFEHAVLYKRVVAIYSDMYNYVHTKM